jgi:pilus assembly protein CpaC
VIRGKQIFVLCWLIAAAVAMTVRAEQPDDGGGGPPGGPPPGGPPPSVNSVSGAGSAAGDDKATSDAPDTLEVKPQTGQERTLTLPLGLSRTLEFTFEIGSIYQTDASLFDYIRVKDGGKENKLRIIPKNPGVTDFTIHDTNGVPRIKYLVRVTREDLGQVESELEQLLGDIEGLRIRSVGGTIILDGEILLPKDTVRIIRVLDALKDRDPKKKEVPIRNLTTISKITMNILAERIEREIGSPEITARVVNNTLFLEGTAENEFEADRAVEIARTYLPEAVVEKLKGEGEEVRPKTQGGAVGGTPFVMDLLRVRPRQASPPSQDIKITMNYVELDNDYETSFSFNWKPLVGDNATVKYDTTVGELTANLVATVSSLIPKLASLKDHGHARILKQEQVIVKNRSDSPAVIESSTKLFSRVVNDRGEASLQEIPIQNVTKVKAAILDGSDSIDLGVQITLNALASQNSGQPQISTNSLQTQVTVKNGDSAALGGYAIDQAVASYNRNSPPAAGGGAAQTSPLFNLTREKSFNHAKQQYVIFITPEVLRTASAGTEDITRKFRLNAGEK